MVFDTADQIQHGVRFFKIETKVSIKPIPENYSVFSITQLITRLKLCELVKNDKIDMGAKPYSIVYSSVQCLWPLESVT